MMSCKIPLLKNLTFFQDENGEGSWLFIDEFFNFLKRNHKESDTLKYIRKANIEREIKTHKNGLKYFGDKPAASFSSVIRFIFYHADQLGVCSQIIDQIEYRLGPSTEDTNLSLKSLYDNISKFSLKINLLENALLNNVVIDEQTIPSLHNHYKSDFSPHEWQKICVFEYHFSQCYSEYLEDSFENLLRKRYEFLERLKISKQIANDLERCSKSTIKHRIQRQQDADEWFLVEIEAEKIHRPQMLEDQLISYVNENGKILNNVACVGCTNACDHDASIHVYIELDSTDIEISYITTLITHFLQRKHGTKCQQVVFCIPGAFAKFISSDGKVERFHLRDAIANKKFNSEIWHCWNSKEKTDSSTNVSEKRCDSCFNPNLPQPLHCSNFSYAQEWLLDVPLVLQIMLETFINHKSLRKTDNLSGFVKSKVTKLYTLYDTLLNISNRNYIGVFQDISTQDLSLNYQSISTVFAITSASGTTLSLKEAEERMKAKANIDLCYYNTYLRKHKIEYETVAGQIESRVSLRDCVLVLMLDNLVRLKYHADPEPGENRSQQIYTLPITLKGVPKDSLEVSYWHDMTQCDENQPCSCKKDRKLSKEDIETHMLSLLPAEEEAHRTFQKLCIWDFSQIWLSVFKSDIWCQVAKIVEENVNQHNVVSTVESDLDESFASLGLQDSYDNVLENIGLDDILDANEKTEDRSDNDEPDGISGLLSDVEDLEFKQLLKQDFDDFEEEFLGLSVRASLTKIQCHQSCHLTNPFPFLQSTMKVLAHKLAVNQITKNQD